MSALITIAIVAVQFVLTFGAMFALYMLLALLDYQGGLANFLGLALFHPFIAIILSLVTIVLCTLAGLPIRINKRLNRWWRTHFYLAFLMALLGLGACMFSFLPGNMESVTYTLGEVETTREVPNQKLLITGWFLLAFGLFHTFPPKGLQDKLETFLSRATKRSKS